MMKTRKPAELTITKATSQARRVADRVALGTQIFISSRGSWDLATDTHLMITEISVPANWQDAWLLANELQKMAGASFRSVDVQHARIVLTRAK